MCDWDYMSSNAILTKQKKEDSMLLLLLLLLLCVCVCMGVWVLGGANVNTLVPGRAFLELPVGSAFEFTRCTMW